ncbi:MAG: FAD-dependent oxidoreductase, partial [Acidimicrobiales bacterium]
MGDPPSDLARPPIAVVGGGPAGLTAAYELRRLGQPCVVFEANPNRVGGIARTDEYKGYRFDIGGHRFFTKSDEVRQLWHRFLPDGEFLTVRRMSRIYYQGKFFDYPLKAGDALRKLGLVEAARCGLSYLRAAAGPKPTAVSFEDWVVQRFGRRLYQIFFKTYTEKVWGMPCTEISADWAAQRIKGLSLYRAVKQSLFGQGKGEVVKTLIDQFEYPRFGPGMMWEHLAAELAGDGVPVHLGATVARIGHRDGRVVEIDVDDAGGTRTLAVGGAISSMPLRSLVAALDPAAPEEVQAAAGALRYRDFLTVVLVID